jgi:hypothetical protein
MPVASNTAIVARGGFGVKCAAVVTALMLGTGSAAAETPIAEVSQLRLYSNFWQNLHHFLYVSAWANRPAVPGTPRLAMPLPQAPVVMLPSEEQATWGAAVAYYERNIASRDLLFDDDLTRVKVALADADARLGGVGIDEALRSTLILAAPIYRKYWWAEHDAANRAWIEQVSHQTATVAAPIITRLTRLYDVRWFTIPVRVDVVRAGKSQGAYTSINPRPHIVIASGDSSYDGWAGTEMLFHESSHALFLNVRRAVDSAVRVARKEPRDLWHVVLFYIAGEVTRQQLAAEGLEYRPYLYATGLFDRAWPAFREPVERHVRPFVDGQISLDRMAADLAQALP